jgi:thiamine pyrophosphate-dependent acetolactate synthase large subunit-like protein
MHTWQLAHEKRQPAHISHVQEGFLHLKQRLSGAQAIIKTLRAFHIETIFGIPGVHTLALYDAMRDEVGLRHVLARHEQGAGFMAEGYARIQGRPGVVCTITGPGATNVATPVASAYADSVPLLVISSSSSTSSDGRGRGELHEIKNQLALMEALTGWTRAVKHVEEIPDALRDAFRSMHLGRPRGAYLQVPFDILATQAEVEIPTEPLKRNVLRPTEATLKAAVQLLLNAHRPVIIAGEGVTAARANDLLRRLAERLDAPVLLGSKSHDVLASTHPLVLTASSYISSELREMLEQSDLALVVGSKLGLERTGEGRLPIPSTLIHIDIDPAEIGRNYPTTVSVVADAYATLEELLAALPASSAPRQARTDEIARVRESLHRHTAKYFDVALLDALREALPRDGIVVADMTMLGYASAQYLPVYEARTFIHPAEFCTIGCGLPLALGAKVAAPERPVVALCGDGGFLLNTGELATAVQEQIPVVVVIFNDATFTAVKSEQKRHFHGRYIATDVRPPDYVALARAFHAQGLRAETPDALRDALSTALQASGPTVIEVPLPARQW